MQISPESSTFMFGWEWILEKTMYMILVHTQKVSWHKEEVDNGMHSKENRSQRWDASCLQCLIDYHIKEDSIFVIFTNI